MKIKETTKSTAGGIGREREVTTVRVRVLAAGEEMPAGAEQVPDKTKTHDWKEVN